MALETAWVQIPALVLEWDQDRDHQTRHIL